MSDIQTIRVKGNVWPSDPAIFWNGQNAAMYESPGTILRRLRKERKLTQAAVAEAVGIERQTLSGIESDKAYARPGRETAIALADFYRVPFDSIFRTAAPDIRQSVQTTGELALLKLWRRMNDAQRDLVISVAESVDILGKALRSADDPEIPAAPAHTKTSRK